MDAWPIWLVCLITAIVTLLIIAVIACCVFLIWLRCLGPFKSELNDNPPPITLVDPETNDRITLRFNLVFKSPRDGCINFVFSKVYIKLFYRKDLLEADPLYGPKPQIEFTLSIAEINGVPEVTMQENVVSKGVKWDYQVKQLIMAVTVEDLPYDNTHSLTSQDILHFLNGPGANKFNNLRKNHETREIGLVEIPEETILGLPTQIVHHDETSFSNDVGNAADSTDGTENDTHFQPSTENHLVDMQATTSQSMAGSEPRDTEPKTRYNSHRTPPEDPQLLQGLLPTNAEHSSSSPVTQPSDLELFSHPSGFNASTAVGNNSMQPTVAVTQDPNPQNFVSLRGGVIAVHYDDDDNESIFAE